jgi:hypothetical protein
MKLERGLVPSLVQAGQSQNDEEKSKQEHDVRFEQWVSGRKPQTSQTQAKHHHLDQLG